MASAGSKRRSTEVSSPLPAAVIKRLAREYSDILANKHGVDYLGVEPQAPDDLSRWKGWVLGAPGSPYEGGTFCVRLSIPSDYPFRPPGLQFDTKTYHCNIDSSGGVCLNLLKSEWSPSQTLISLMQMRTDRATHDRIAREWTQRYATTSKIIAAPPITSATRPEHAESDTIITLPVAPALPEGPDSCSADVGPRGRPKRQSSK